MNRICWTSLPQFKVDIFAFQLIFYPCNIYLIFEPIVANKQILLKIFMFEKNIIFHSHMQIYNRKCGIYGCILSFSNDVVFVSRLGIDWFIAIQQRLTATCFPLSLHSFIGCWIVPLNWMYPSDIRWNIPYWIFQICKWKMPKINPSIHYVAI